MTDKLKIKCPYCSAEIFVDIWKIKSSHKVLCRNCNKFFKLQVSGQSPDYIKKQIENELNKISRRFK